MSKEAAYRCVDCLYANELYNGDVYCDKREFEEVKIIVPKDKVDRNCPSHSSYPTEETRYSRPWKYLRDADDVCQVCGRMLDLRVNDQYKYVKVEKKDGNIDVIRKCNICINKGR